MSSVDFKKGKILFIDLDGTVRKGKEELGHFVNGPEDVELFLGVKDRLWRFRKSGYHVVGVSNQGGISLGFVTYESIRASMDRTQELTSGAFSRIYFCPHHPESVDKKKRECNCRKPRTGMVIEATVSLAKEYKEYFEPVFSLFVGDREEDKLCAKSACIPFMEARTWRTYGEPIGASLEE